MTTRQKIVEIARSLIGVKEEGGDNQGGTIEKFQKAVDGKAAGEPWCCCFVQFCVKTVDARLDKSNVLPQTEHCVTLWNQTPSKARYRDPEIGFLAVWEEFKNGRPTGSGHVGIVVEVVDDKRMKTIEGNTGPGVGIEREGDGVYEKNRASTRVEAGSLRLLGFIDPWLGA